MQCSEIDADAILTRLKKAIANGKPINELEAIYLPLFRSQKFTPSELFTASVELIKAMQADDNHKRKVMTLLATLCGKIVNRAQVEAAMEEALKMGNVIFEYLEERGEQRNQEETAKRMIAKGYDSLEIVDLTGIDIERLREIRKGVCDDMVLA